MFAEEFAVGPDAAHGYNHAVDLKAKSRAGGGWRFWAAVLAVWALTELAGVRSWVDELAGMHAPDDYEQFMEFAAEKTNAPQLCAKIPWSAYSRGGWDSAAAYARSECYEAVARNTGSPWLCLYVKRLGSPAILRQQTSMFSCLEGVQRRHGMGAGVGPPTRLHFFEAMGYSPDTIQEEGVIGPLVRVKDIYRGLSDRYGLQIGRNASGNATVVVPGTLSKDVLMARIEHVIGQLIDPASRSCHFRQRPDRQHRRPEAPTPSCPAFRVQIHGMIVAVGRVCPDGELFREHPQALRPCPARLIRSPGCIVLILDSLTTAPAGSGPLKRCS